MIIGAITLLLVINLLPSFISSIVSAATTTGITSNAQSTVQLNQIMVSFLPMAVVAALVIYALSETGVIKMG